MEEETRNDEEETKNNEEEAEMVEDSLQNDKKNLSSTKNLPTSEQQNKMNRSNKFNKSNKSTKSKQNSANQSVNESARTNQQEEINAAADLLEAGKDPADFDHETLIACVDIFKAKKTKSVKEGNYLKANDYAKLIKSCQKTVDVTSFTSQCTQKLDDYREKMADAQEQLDQVNQIWDDRFYEFEAQIETKLQDLTQQQNEELDNFNKSTPENLPPQYQKFSSELLLMRKREKLLLRNEEYIDAHKLKAKADAREAEELEQQQSKFLDDRLKKQNALIEKHNQQYNAFAEWVKEHRQVMIQQRAKETEGPLKRLQHYTELVESIEKNGLPPNPSDGFTTNKVNRKQSIQACRTAAQTPLERTEKKRQRSGAPIPSFRPASVMSGSSSRKHTASSLHTK